MSVRELLEPQSVELGTVKAAILEVDGVPLRLALVTQWSKLVYYSDIGASEEETAMPRIAIGFNEY